MFEELVAGETGGFVKASLRRPGGRSEIRPADPGRRGRRSGRRERGTARRRDRRATGSPPSSSDIPPESAFRVIDAAGQIVTPGLVDLHTHVFHKITYWGIDPDPVASRTGVTTWNDAGSAGALTIAGVPRLRRPARRRSGSPRS